MPDRCFSPEELLKIFSFESSASYRLTSRENSRLEFKEAFNLGSADEYAKTAAAFANAQGGYLVFGVKDSPRQLLGLKSANFESFDPAKLTNALNERFSPEIHWESYLTTQRRVKIGILYFAEALHKPVVCTKASGCLQQGSIYYRYRGRSESIRFPELRKILDEEIARERNLWMRQLRRIRDAGVENVAILNLQSGEVSGASTTFYVSEDLLPKLQFIREGHFVENNGAPALRLLGDLRPVEGPAIGSTVRVPAAVHEAEVVAAFLKTETVLSPTEYLRAICFEQSYFLPVYFFIQQTTESVRGIIDLLNGLEVRGTVRDKLVERLKTPKENLAIGNLTGANPAATERRAIVDQLKSKTLPSEVISDGPVRFFEALTHTNAEDFDQGYLFGLLLEHVLPTLSRLGGLKRTYFRKAICHLDLTWFRPSIG